MIAYNKTWLYNLELHEDLDNQYQAGCLTNDEVKAVKSKYPANFYSPGIFIRIGLFILTVIIILFSAGILSLMLVETHVIDSFGWLLFLGLITYAALEVLIKQKKHHQSGVDDALLLLSGTFLMCGFAWMVYKLNDNYQDTHYTTVSLFVFILSTYFTLRFVNLLMATIAGLSLFTSIFFLWQNAGMGGISTMPFFMMLASAVVYWIAVVIDTNTITRYYKNCIIIIKIISLVTLYAAGNYFIIDTLSRELNGTEFSSHAPIKFSPFFWAWTMLLPIIFTGLGIYKKNAVLLRTGLVLIVFSISTFRIYFHVISAELALIIAGVILIAIVYGVIKYLKKDKHGFTYADTNEANLLDKIKLESLIISETLGHTPAPVKPAERFGGGDFGGGGSSGAF